MLEGSDRKPRGDDGVGGPGPRLAHWLLLALIALTVPTSLPATEAGPTLDLGAYRGRVVVVDFWASWCAPCRRSIPWLNEMRARYGDRGLVVIGVNVDTDARDAERFMRDVPLDFEVVYDPQGTLAAQYALEGMPSSYVYSRDGELVARHLGFQNAQRAEYEALLARLLQ
jgi:thiol-disulfide isomerase/thioredoxin